MLLDGGASPEKLARRVELRQLSASPSERYQHREVNFVSLGALVQALSQKPWSEALRDNVFGPLAMQQHYTDHNSARTSGMTELHRYRFGIPIAQPKQFPDGLARAGGLVVSADDIAKYLAMMPQDARWHLGDRSSIAAWITMIQRTRQAVVVLINANSELPAFDAGATFGRLPIGIVNLPAGQRPPIGPGVRDAYVKFDAMVALMWALIGAFAWWLARRAAALAIVLAGWIATGDLGWRAWLRFAPDATLSIALMLRIMLTPAAYQLLRRRRIW